MKLTEGLTGLALKELRAICEKNASRNPHFKHFPGIGEEQYESFLAVPIVRGQTRIGVVVVQNKQKDYFTEDDVKAFKAITSQLANTIETAKVLMTFREKATPTKTVPMGELKLVKGRVGSQGFAFAEALVVQEEPMLFSAAGNSLQDRYTLDDFYRAVGQA